MGKKCLYSRIKLRHNKEIQYKDSNNSYLLRDYVDY